MKRPLRFGLTERSCASCLAGAVPVLMLVAACSQGTPIPSGPAGGIPGVGPNQCDLDLSLVLDGGVGRDGIPSLQNPPFVSADPQEGNAYLGDGDRVIGFVLDGQAYAVPHNILWSHEVVNLDVGGEKIAITYCPLTGSSLGFDRASVGGQEFGVSGLLFSNNLILYNRGTEQTLWPQMMSRAVCGSRTGEALEQIPILELNWAGWKSLFPETRVVSSATGYDANYRRYPYGQYESLISQDFFFNDAMPPLDRRRHVKERVLGLPSREGEFGAAFPFGALSEQEGDWAVVQQPYQGTRAAVFWSTEAEGAMAFWPVFEGEELEFDVDDRGIVDLATGSLWDIAGRAVEGELAGAQLEPVAEAYVAFWGAWAAFHPRTRLWTGE